MGINATFHPPGVLFHHDQAQGGDRSQQAGRTRTTGLARTTGRTRSTGRTRVSPPAPPPADDDGFTLVEVLVSIALISVVLAAVATFLVNSMAITNVQRGRQTGAQLAADAIEQARALRGPGVLTDRDRSSVEQQWADALSAVSGELAAMVPAWDSDATYPAGATAPLPTLPEQSILGGVSYQQRWYVGTCWQPLGGGACGSTGGSGSVQMYRIVVAVSWPERNCTGGTCSFVSAALISSGSDEPVFNVNQVATAPTANPPLDQLSQVNVPVTPLSLTATGGTAPLTWSASGLPPGLTMSSDGHVTGRPTTAGSYHPTVQVTDGFGSIGSATLLWTVVPPPTITRPTDQISVVGDVVALAPAASGGTAPYSWSATGLPAGVSIATDSGMISGKVTTARAATPVTVTITDMYGQADSATFTWTVLARPTITTPVTARTDPRGGAVSIQATATGGTGSYTWSAVSLPPGLTISPSGLITGTITGGTRYLSAITVRDSAGASTTVTVPWTVTASSGLRITAPLVDRIAGPANDADQVGRPVTVQMGTAGKTGNVSWTVTGLPPGISRTGNNLTGTPTVAGSYTVTVVARDSSGATSTVMFLWEVR